VAKVQGKYGEIRVGRILNEDDKSIVLEIQKHEDNPIDLFGGEQFLTLLFVHSDNGQIKSWIPWDKDSD
jgi:hypothetical protein